MAKQFLISVIIPVFNEEQNIKPLVQELTNVLKPYSYEIIFINDGSKDHTIREIKKHTKNESIRLLSFTRNFGHQMALSCGYMHAKGDCVISMDSDMQDPPSVIPEMIGKWENGYQIVYAKRQKREVDSWFKRSTARFFYQLINVLSDTPIPEDVGDFRLLDRSVVEFLNLLPERSRFLRGLVAWGGFSSTSVMFNRERRLSGATHYTLSRMFNFALEGITSFSTKPLRIATLLGFISGLIGFL
ncbi:MAG: glycosyltransferase family 2 protein, partial [Patescibacteria group bacterium]